MKYFSCWINDETNTITNMEFFFPLTLQLQQLANTKMTQRILFVSFFCLFGFFCLIYLLIVCFDFILCVSMGISVCFCFLFCCFCFVLYLNKGRKKNIRLGRQGKGDDLRATWGGRSMLKMFCLNFFFSKIVVLYYNKVKEKL